jgi:hypothetical protein
MRISKKEILRVLFLLFIGIFLFTDMARAYIDLGSGSYFFQVLIAAFFGILFTLKGYWKKIENSILDAYDFPNHAGDPYLYDSITPVNSFRILFNLYFGTHFELLKDESFFSTWEHPYQFIPVRPYE